MSMVLPVVCTTMRGINKKETVSHTQTEAQAEKKHTIYETKSALNIFFSVFVLYHAYKG